MWKNLSIYLNEGEKIMSNEIIYEDDTIIVYGEYDPASHIYNDNEVNLNIRIEKV